MTYTIWNKEYEDKQDAERMLSAMFLYMCQDVGIDCGDDSVAWCTVFNDWTDALCKDGSICDASYQDLCPVGDVFE